MKRILVIVLAIALFIGILPVSLAEEPITLTLWMALDGKHAASLTSLDYMPAFMELEKKFNVDLQFIHPSGDVNEAFKLMLASQVYPDMVYYNWNNTDIGELIQDGFIYELTDYVEEYAPNYYKVLSENPEAMRQATFDGNRFHAFCFLQLDSGLRAGGPVIRKDWLDKLSLESPNTVEEWHEVLCAFRDNDPNGNGLADEIPIIAEKGTDLESLQSWTSAFGTIQGFCMKDGQVTYGPIEPEFKEYLTTMHDWFAEGLIDPDFASQDRTSFSAKATGDIGGAWIGRVNATLGNYMQVKQNDGTGFYLAGTPWPETADGASYNLRGNMLKICDGTGTAITTANKYPEKSMEIIDYIYSTEGNYLFNFGIEGESYTMVDGNAIYTDIINKNPDGLSPVNAIAHYCMAATTFSMIQDIGYFRQTMVFDSQKQAISAWSESSTDLLVPPIKLTAEEMSRQSEIMNDVTTFVSEWATKTIMGQIPLDEYDNYLAQLLEMNIEEAIGIQNAAYDRYVSD